MKVNRILFLIFLLLIPIGTAATCVPLNIYGGQSSLTDFPVFVRVPSNIGTNINVTNWTNIRFYQENCANVPSTKLLHEIDSFNSTQGNFWIKFSTLSTGINNISMIIDSASTVNDQNKTQIWSTEYSYVYHLGEGIGNISLDSTGRNNISGTYNMTVGIVNFNWINSTMGKGISAQGSYSPQGGICGISQINISSDLTGDKNLSIFAFGQRLGNATAAAAWADIFAMGEASVNGRYTLRAGQPTSNVWRLDKNAGSSFNTGTNADLSYNSHYVQHYNGVDTWLLNKSTIATNTGANSIISTPLTVGCAYWSGYSGYVLDMFNGTIDEVRVSNKTFSSEYINRTMDGAFNTSLIFFGTETNVSSSILDTSNLVAYFKNDELSGTTLVNTIDQTKNGTMYFGVNWTSGKILNATQYMGSNQSVIIKDYVIPNSSKSISLWVYSYDTTNPQIIIAGGDTGTKEGWGIGYNSVAGNNKFWLWGQGSDLTANITSPPNYWNYVVATQNASGSRKLYVNGKLVANSSDNYNIGSKPFRIGNYPSGSGGSVNFTGRVDEISLWERELSSEEVNILFSSGGGRAYPFSLTSFESVIGNYSYVYNLEAYETSRERFVINITKINSSLLISSASIFYKNTSYSGTISDLGSSALITANLDLPLVRSSGSYDINEFNWDLITSNSSGDTHYNSSTAYQQVLKTNIVICNSTYQNFSLANFTTKSATSPYPNKNATMRISWDWSLGNTTTTLQRNSSYEDLSEANYTWNFCGTVNANYTIDAQIQYDAVGFAPNNYYLDNAMIQPNQTNQITLYLLNNTLATLTQFLVQTPAQQGIQDVIIQVQMYDVGLDQFFLVSMMKTSYAGTDISYLNWYDTFYKFILLEDGEVIKSVDPNKISESPQTITIFPDNIFTFEKFRDFQYTLTYNNATQNFVLTYTKPSGLVTAACMRVVKRSISNETTLSEQCNTASSGTIYYNIGGQGNGTFVASFYATGSFSPIDWLSTTIGGDLADTIHTLLGEDAPVYAIMFSAVTLGAMFFNPVLGVIAILLSMLGASALGFTNVSFATYIGLVLIGGIVILFIRR